MDQNKFISSDQVVAIVKEELDSYFAAGALDDVMFPTWIKNGMKDFRVDAMPHKSVALCADNYTADLPKDFKMVDKLTSCSLVASDWVQNPSSFYYQTDCRITPMTDPCNECFQDMDKCRCDGSLPPKQEKYRVTHKVTGNTLFEYYRTLTLKPASSHARASCHPQSANLNCDNLDTFTIRDCKLILNFSKGYLHLDYYGDNEDEYGELLIEDNQYITDYLVSWLKYKCFEKLWNSSSDESNSQLQNKMSFYKQEAIENKVRAMDDKKKLTKYQVANMIKRQHVAGWQYRATLR